MSQLSGSASSGNELSSIPFRAVDYLPVRLDVEKRTDGSFILKNLNPMGEPSENALQPLKEWAQKKPDRVWLAERPEGKAQKGLWNTKTYSQAWQEVQALASQLIERGIGKDAPLMILSGNSIEHGLMTYAAMLAGAAVAPVSTGYSLMSSDFAKLKHVYKTIKPKAIFVQDYEPFAPALEALDTGGGGVDIISVKGGGNHTSCYEDLLTPLDLDKVAESYRNLRADDVAKLLFTSGSTGMPKAVINTHRILCVNMVMGKKLIVEEDDFHQISVSWLPWNHVFGGNAILHGVLVNGGTLYLDRGKPLPNLFDETILTLKEIAPTTYSNVPMAYTMLADALEQDDEMAELFFSRVRYLAYGGAALSQELADRVQKIAVKTTGERILFTTGYGATETGPTIMNVHWITERMGLLGLPLPGVEIKLSPVGSKLEVRARGDCITPGYYKDAEKTQAAFDDEGFYRLGDGAKFVDDNDISKGIVFDGRIAEDFKLSSGTWVNAGRLRVSVIDACDGLLKDCVVAGLDREYIAVLGFVDSAVVERAGGLEPARALLSGHLRAYNARGSGSSTRVKRLLLQSAPPNVDKSEITDKGYINQGAVLSARASEVARLYAPEPDDDIIIV